MWKIQEFFKSHLRFYIINDLHININIIFQSSRFPRIPQSFIGIARMRILISSFTNQVFFYVFHFYFPGKGVKPQQ